MKRWCISTWASIIIEADTMDEAREKYESGDYDIRDFVLHEGDENIEEW